VQVSVCQLWLQKKLVPVIFEPTCVCIYIYVCVCVCVCVIKQIMQRDKTSVLP